MESLSKYIMDNLPETIIVFDKDGIVLFANKEWLDSYGYSRGEVVGKNFQELIDEDGAEMHMVKECFFKTLATGKSQYCNKLRHYHHKEAKFIPYSVKIIPVLDEKDESSGLCIIGSNLEKETNLDEKNKQLEVFTTVSELAAGMAHKIRNPLTTVRGFIQLIQSREEQKGADGDYRDYFETILSEIDNASAIISEFLSIAQPVLQEEEKIDINKILDEIILLLDTRTILQYVEVERYYTRKLPRVNLDKSDLRKIFLAIIQNAFEALPNGGRITVSTSILSLEKKIMVVIEDNGEGIPDPILDMVMAPYFTTRGGTGLGLTIAKEILETAGGSIEIISTVNKGTKVIVKICTI